MLRISLMWMTAIALTLATACSDLPDSVKSERQIANEIVECQLEQGGGLGIAFMGGKESVADCHAHCRPYLDPDSYLTPYSQPGGAPAANLELKTYMLELINKERARAGVQPVTLGSNDAAQLHTESASKALHGSSLGYRRAEALYALLAGRWLPGQWRERQWLGVLLQRRRKGCAMLPSPV